MLDADDLDGAFIRTIVESPSGTFTATLQLADGSAATLAWIIGAGGGGGLSVAQVQALIDASIIPARTDAQINALVTAFNYLTESQIQTLIDNSVIAARTDAEIQALIDASVALIDSGSKTLLAQADYDDSTGVLQFSQYQGGDPTSIIRGDLIVFAAPNNINDDQEITVDDRINARIDELYDLDDNVVHGHNLSPGRIYTARLLVRGSGNRYRLTLPLGIEQINPLQTTTLAITNDQLKALNLTYLEIIPAPGVGKFIEVSSWQISINGADEFTNVTGVSVESVRSWMNISLLYDYTQNLDYPLHTSGGEISQAARYNFKDYGLFESTTDLEFNYISGGQPLANNKALMVGATVGIGRAQRTFGYGSDARWDAYWLDIDDKAMSIELKYFIHT